MLLMAYQDDLASRVKSARLAAGWTQEKLAAKAGIVSSTVSKIERGASETPDLSTLQALADALQLDPRSLMPAPAATDAPPPPPAYAAFLEFCDADLGKTMSDPERAFLGAVRLPAGEQPTVMMYQQWLLAYRLSRHAQAQTRRA
jgi:transcriptional regulator with XRE-family HTH domain